MLVFNVTDEAKICYWFLLFFILIYALLIDNQIFSGLSLLKKLTSFNL